MMPWVRQPSERMEIAHTIAPTYRQLRPLKPVLTATFPVYRDLAHHLVATEAHPEARTAHVMATCAGYSYSDERTVAMMMARMGLEENCCLKIAESVDAMFVCSTAFLVQSSCGRVVILCYRGTERANFINWLTDADVHPERVPFRFATEKVPFQVHAGFYRNVRSTRYEVITALQRALEGRSIDAGERPVPHPLQALYVTGHSLGAAMAAMMGVMLATEPAYVPIFARLRAVYTFGQPMIGGPELAAACQAHPFLEQGLVRYVYGNDVFAALPPRASGDFAHFGQEYQWVRDEHGKGQWRHNRRPIRQSMNPVALPLAVLEFLAHKFRQFRTLTFPNSVDDHGPQHYIAALTPPDVRTEFGD